MLNKNTLGIKKVRGQEEAALWMNQRLKALISSKAKKFLLWMNQRLKALISTKAKKFSWLFIKKSFYFNDTQ